VRVGILMYRSVDLIVAILAHGRRAGPMCRSIRVYRSIACARCWKRQFRTSS
jgi:hypothetical protein